MQRIQAQIYIHLEEDDASRPTQALVLGDNLYQILPTPDYDAEDEVWEFIPGTIVRCEEREYNGKPYLQAVEEVVKSPRARTRTEALSKLLYYREPIEELVKNLAQFPFDSEEILVVLTPSHLRHLLQRYVNNELTDKHLEDWANTIEGRDDIGFLPKHQTLLEEAVFTLANPLLAQQTTADYARQILKLFEDEDKAAEEFIKQFKPNKT